DGIRDRNVTGVQTCALPISVAFGVAHTRHYLIDQNPTDDIYTEIWDFEPKIHVTKPMIRQYSEKTKAHAVIDRTEKRRKAKAEFLKQKQLEEKWLEKYMDNQRIELDKIKRVEPKFRQILLSCIVNSISHKTQNI